MSAMSPLVSHDAPEIFFFDGAGELIFRSEIGAAEAEVAGDAVFLCPTQAVTLTEEP